MISESGETIWKSRFMKVSTEYVQVQVPTEDRNYQYEAGSKSLLHSTEDAKIIGRTVAVGPGKFTGPC